MIAKATKASGEHLAHLWCTRNKPSLIASFPARADPSNFALQLLSYTLISSIFHAEVNTIGHISLIGMCLSLENHHPVPCMLIVRHALVSCTFSGVGVLLVL